LIFDLIYNTPKPENINNNFLKHKTSLLILFFLWLLFKIRAISEIAVKNSLYIKPRRRRIHHLPLATYHQSLLYMSTRILQKNTSFHVKKIHFCKKLQKTAKNCALLRASINQYKTMQKPALFTHFSPIHVIFQSFKPIINLAEGDSSTKN